MVSQANEIQSNEIVIDSSLTKLITVNETITYKLQASIENKYFATGIVSFTIEPYMTTVIDNYTSSYIYNASRGFYFYPVMSFPECTEKSP
jgi:hypothetical protein